MYNRKTVAIRSYSMHILPPFSECVYLSHYILHLELLLVCSHQYMCPVLILGTSKSEIRFNAPYHADDNYDSTGIQRRNGFACHLRGFVSTVCSK